MASFREWLKIVLEGGVSEQADPPVVVPADREPAEAILRSAYRTHALTVGAPPLPIDMPVAFDAALTLAEACWHLVTDDAPLPDDRLKPPSTPSAHLSADLTLRLLPAAYRRAKARRPDDPLAAFCETLFRRCPLSGVLSGIDEGPESFDFHGHVGLHLLYAERLVEHPRAAWVPSDGPLREQVDRVFAERRKPVPKPVPVPESAP